MGYLDNKIPSQGMEFMNGVIDETPNISVINKIEVLRFNTTDEVYKTLVDFIDECTIYDINGLVVEDTIAICRQNKIKLPDAIIAATARVYGFTLITRNTPIFKNITGLELVDPWKFNM